MGQGMCRLDWVNGLARDAYRGVGIAAWKVVAGTERVESRLAPRRRSHAVLWLVMVAWEPDRSLAVIQHLEAAVRPFAIVRPVVVANSEGAHQLFASSEYDLVVRGSNADAEFSGYDQGLDAVRDAGCSPDDIVMIANDRARVGEPGTLRLLSPRVLENVKQFSIAVGHVESFSKVHEVMGRPVKTYLRTDLFLMPGSAVIAGFTTTSLGQTEMDRLVPRQFLGVWAFDSVLHPNCSAFLRQWLTVGDHQETWYAARELSQDSWPVLRRKTQNIINEHLMPTRLRRAGLQVVSLRQAGLHIGSIASLDRLEARAHRIEHSRRLRLVAVLRSLVADLRQRLLIKH